MTPSNESDLRHRTAALALAWSEERAPFTGVSQDEYPPMIVAAHIVADEARLALHRWIDASRRAGLSWAEIGALIGVSKQAAQQRFGGGRDDDLPESADFIDRYGATAFNEMAIMAEEGANRRELVGTGALRLRFVQTERAWEYRRIVGTKADAAMMTEGWLHVSSWMPFHYYKRPVA